MTRLLGRPEVSLVSEYSSRLIREREELSKTHLLVSGVTANAREEQKAQMMAAGIDKWTHHPYINTDPKLRHS
jgi:CheY-like chemotaxis protein